LRLIGYSTASSSASRESASSSGSETTSSSRALVAERDANVDVKLAPLVRSGDFPEQAG
jgi:hypothetical protein